MYPWYVSPFFPCMSASASFRPPGRPMMAERQNPIV